MKRAAPASEDEGDGPAFSTKRTPLSPSAVNVAASVRTAPERGLVRTVGANPKPFKPGVSAAFRPPTRRAPVSAAFKSPFDAGKNGDDARQAVPPAGPRRPIASYAGAARAGTQAAAAAAAAAAQGHETTAVHSAPSANPASAMMTAVHADRDRGRDGGAVVVPRTIHQLAHPSSSFARVPSRSCAQNASGASGAAVEPYFTALYCKRKTAKNRASKSWMDGFVRYHPPFTTLFDDAGKTVTKGRAGTCVAGTTLEINNWEAEVGDPISAASFVSGAALAGAGAVATALPTRAAAAEETTRRPFRTTVAGLRGGAATPEVKPLHDPAREGALLLSCEGVEFPKLGRATVSVVVDPFIGDSLRPHQREGVRFMYECVSGLRRDVVTGAAHTGCLLAHEMGMGKTLQVVALLWTLLKQGPIAGRPPPVRRAVIACPASLVGNWGAEINKWLGKTRLDPLCVEGGDKDAKQMFDDWALPHQRKWSVLVTSYETLRTYSKTVAKGGVDLLVCDEAHRLKSAKGDTQTVASLRALRCERRVLLSGTPIQNNLGEFYAVMDFACPGLLGDLSKFRRVFSGPVERSRDKHASEEERALGEARGAQLGKMTEAFVQRARAEDVNRNLLPPKTEYVVFCRLAPRQAALYDAFLRESAVRSMLRGGGSGYGGLMPLQAIQHLQRLCNSACLLMAPKKDGNASETQRLQSSLCDHFSREACGHLDPSHPNTLAHHSVMSGKMAVLMHMLVATQRGVDRTVVVSGYTSTLDVIASACEAAGLGKISRLDGSVAPNQRKHLVDSFNAGYGGDVFLLSCKAGGVGLNLIGANRLVLFDSDWNPANDLQAMARIWRDGQKRPVVIYRLVSTGTIEEKVFQRQMLKGDVANCMGYAAAAGLDGEGGSSSGSLTFLSKEELRDLFTFNADTPCDTVEVLESGETIGGRRAHQRGLKRALPAHWRGCAEVEDTPLASALSLMHSVPEESASGATNEVVSFVVQLPSEAPSDDRASEAFGEFAAPPASEVDGIAGSNCKPKPFSGGETDSDSEV